MPFEWLKFAHVLTIIFAMSLAEGTIVPTYLAGRRRDVEAIRQGIALSEIGEKIANPLALISILFGIGAALAGQIDLTASWLIATYVLLGVAIGIGIFGGFRHIEQIRKAALASPSDAASDELVAAIKGRWTFAVYFLPPLIMATIILLMVLKPTLW
jgi:hypothetical protein